MLATVICFAVVVGEFRTFLQAEVQASFVNMIHHPGYEYFVVTDKPFPVRNGDDNVVHNRGAAAAADDVGVQVSPLRSWVLDRLYQHIELKSVRYDVPVCFETTTTTTKCRCLAACKGVS
mmetsp:Transcript_37447/g.60122  ORF Transcript_37447/g.60122 Transcript_37447/m.60122 type:complete len:120 (+) Transcript_37447:479-838(+)